VVEGTPLLRVQIGNGLEGSNPFLSATDLWNAQSSSISSNSSALAFLLFQ
jgi:hypothetical protein